MRSETRRLLARLAATFVVVLAAALLASWWLGGGQRQVPELREAEDEGAATPGEVRVRAPEPAPEARVEVVVAPPFAGLFADAGDGVLLVRVVPPMRRLPGEGHVLDLTREPAQLVVGRPGERELLVVAAAPSRWEAGQRERFVHGLELLLGRLRLGPAQLRAAGEWRAELAPLLGWAVPRDR